MQEKISLLYKTGKKGSVQSFAEQAIYNLNIDRMVSAACEQKKHADYFLSVLSRGGQSAVNASYRAEILRDFIKYPELLSSLFQLFKGYENLPEETEEIINEIFRYGMPASASGILDCAYEELYVNAHYARNVIAYFSEIFELFNGYDVKSEGLCAMKSFCVSISESKCISELENAAQSFRSENISSYSFTLNAAIDEAMRIVSCSLCSAKDINEKEKKSLKSLFKKDTQIKADVGSACAENASNALAGALGELSGIFADLANGIYSVFRGVGEELMFYCCALDIERHLKKAGMYYCFPTVLDAERDVLKAENIYDMLLINEGKNRNTIVPNNVDLQKSIIARGDNNCGKTSFLRAVGSAVIFAQNGLPVCAESMEISVRGAIFTHFSSAEKDFSDGDAAGRFEGEVKEIAQIMDGVKPYDLILLNETFQTTAYKEGAMGMKDILDILDAIKCRYIFVTHMKAIFSLFTAEQVSILEAKGFKLALADQIT